MNTIIVWVLVTAGGANSNQITYSPMMPSMEVCKEFQKSVLEIKRKRVIGSDTIENGIVSECLPVKIAQTK